MQDGSPRVANVHSSANARGIAGAGFFAEDHVSSAAVGCRVYGSGKQRLQQKIWFSPFATSSVSVGVGKISTCSEAGQSL